MTMETTGTFPKRSGDQGFLSMDVLLLPLQGLIEKTVRQSIYYTVAQICQHEGSHSALELTIRRNCSFQRI